MTDSRRHLLEDRWIEVPLSLVMEGYHVQGVAQLNWGAAEVRLTAPVCHLTRRRDTRGCAFALLAFHRPTTRYVLDGTLTDRGREVAEGLLRDLFLDYLAINRHAGAVTETCRQAREERAALARDYTLCARPLHAERATLRRAFLAGELSQREYQLRRRPIQQRFEALQWERYEGDRELHHRCAETIEGLCERRVSLEEAEKLLSEGAWIVQVRPDSASTRI